MITVSKGVALIERKKVAETKSGIILTSNPADTRGVKGTLIAGEIEGAKIGDFVYADKTKSIDIEGHDEWFFIPIEHVLGFEVKEI